MFICFSHLHFFPCLFIDPWAWAISPVCTSESFIWCLEFKRRRMCLFKSHRQFSQGNKLNLKRCQKLFVFPQTTQMRSIQPFPSLIPCIKSIWITTEGVQVERRRRINEKGFLSCKKTGMWREGLKINARAVTLIFCTFNQELCWGLLCRPARKYKNILWSCPLARVKEILADGKSSLH